MKHIISVFVFFVIISSLISYNCNNNYDNKVVNYDGNNFMISIDGKDSNNLPTNGNYYLTSYKCSNKVTKISWDKENYSLNISNGSKGGGIACNLNFESHPSLSSMKKGSYVKYIGNNGCIGKACEGENINYINDDNMGYCFSKDDKYISSGWRLFYVDDGSSYLVSAGALECVNKSNTVINSLLYINELNFRALSYCNKDYVYNKECNNYSVRSINNYDFEKYLDMNISDCMDNSSNRFCGYDDDMIDIGGYYWFASLYDSAVNKIFSWNPEGRFIKSESYFNAYGLRVVIRLNDSIYVVSGDGTYSNPYVISLNKEVL